jgi:protein-S-isoprenylcysteine O-methyltransferase Ste14
MVLCVTVWRQLRAIGPLPGIGALVIPTMIVLLTGEVSFGWGLPFPLDLLPPLAGCALIAVGLLLMFRTISLFATVGQGTLAPWDPPQRLVARGPYRHVRNPMISGVVFILLGEATLLGSLPLFTWFLVFFALNAVFIPLIEERDLERRFGADYRRYKENVPRWLPRPRPWTGAAPIDQ